MSRAGSSGPRQRQDGEPSIPRQNEVPRPSPDPGHARQAVRPSPERAVPRGAGAGMPRAQSPPMQPQVRHQDAPRHPVHRADDGSSAAAGRALRAPASNDTACNHRPGRGVKRLLGRRRCSTMQARSPASSSPQMSIRRRQSPGNQRRPARPPEASGRLRPVTIAAAMHRDDRAGTARRPRDDRRCRPAGTCSSIAWQKRSIGPPRSSSQCMIGVAGNAPVEISRRGEGVGEQGRQRPPAPQRSDAGIPRAA